MQERVLLSGQSPDVAPLKQKRKPSCTLDSSMFQIIYPTAIADGKRGCKRQIKNDRNEHLIQRCRECTVMIGVES